MLWLSAQDTYDWARKTGATWPCSELANHRLFAAFDKHGLYDLTIDWEAGKDCPGDEFNAITSDFLAKKLPEDHPAWFVTVGQFREGRAAFRRSEYREASSSSKA